MEDFTSRNPPSIGTSVTNVANKINSSVRIVQRLHDKSTMSNFMYSEHTWREYHSSKRFTNICEEKRFLYLQKKCEPMIYIFQRFNAIFRYIVFNIRPKYFKKCAFKVYKCKSIKEFYFITLHTEDFLIIFTFSKFDFIYG